MSGFVSFETWSHVAWAGLELTLIAKGDLEILILLPSRFQSRDHWREPSTVNIPTTPAQICTKTTFRALESLLAPLVCGHFHLDLSRWLHYPDGLSSWSTHEKRKFPTAVT